MLLFLSRFVADGHGLLAQSYELRVSIDATDHDEAVVHILELLCDGREAHVLELQSRHARIQLVARAVGRIGQQQHV